MAAQVFQVITEFSFDAGAFLIGTERAQGAVESLSKAADEALVSFQGLSLGIAAQFGLGGGGIVGTLFKAIQASDKFTQSQLALANVLNPGATFAERMVEAETVMGKINRLAAEFALPTEELLQFTKVLGPLLQSKNLAGPGFSTAIDIGRNLLKSAPTLGIDPTLVQGQLLRMTEGQASTGDTLFNRLTGDTKTMNKFAGNSKAFNVLPAPERVRTIQKALKEFASDANVLSGNVMTLRGQMTLLSDAITGSFSALKPLGDILIKPIVMVMAQINKFLRNEGAAIIKNFAKMIEPFIQSPKRMIVDLMQLRQLQADLNLAGTLLSVAGALVALGGALSWFGITIPLLSSAAAMLTKILTANAFVIGGKMFPLFVKLTGVFTAIFGPLLLLVGVFQLISRAIAIANINMAERFVTFMPRITAALAELSAGLNVLWEGFNNLAEAIAPLFDASNFMGFIDLFDLLASVLEWASEKLTTFLAGFQAFFFAISELVTQIATGGMDFGAVGRAWDAGMEMMFEKILGKIDSPDGAVSQQVMNISKVEMRMDFKEQQEPDRIAFAVKDQFLKGVRNKTQASNKGFSTALGNQ